MSTLIQLVELNAWNGSAEETLRFSTHGYVTARADTPPDTSYVARLKNSVKLKRWLANEDSVKGDSSLSVGTVDLVNSDGELDYLVDYAFAGRKIRVLQVEEGQALSSALLLFEGILEQPRFDWSLNGESVFQIIVRDKAFDLQKTLQTVMYGGTNSLPAGSDGTTDIKGKYKPLLFGYVQKISPVCVNTARLIYQVNNGAIFDVPAVYDRGTVLTKGADYVSEADMQANNPAASTYRVWPAGGMFRLGSTNAGQVLCDAIEGATAASRYPGALMNKVLLKAGVVAGDIDSASLAALDAACPWECGYYAGHDAGVSSSEILDALTESTNSWWVVSGSNKVTTGLLSTPSGTPVSNLHEGNIINLTRRQGKDDTRGIPSWRLVVGYAKYWTVQINDFAAAVTVAVREDWGQEYRTVTSSDVAVQTAYATSEDTRVNTLIRYAADAQSLCNSQLALFKTKRDVLLCDAYIKNQSISVGSIIRLTLPRFGLDSGKLFLVIGTELDSRIGRISLTLWG